MSNSSVAGGIGFDNNLHEQPCKICLTKPDAKQLLTCFVDCVDKESSNLFTTTLIGLFHAALHLSEDKAEMMLWFQPTTVLKSMVQITKQLTRNFERGRPTHNMLLRILRNRYEH